MSDNSPPVWGYDVIPEGWKVAVIGGVHQNVRSSDHGYGLNFISLWKGEYGVDFTQGEELLKIVSEHDANLGLSDARKILLCGSIPDRVSGHSLSGHSLVFPGTTLVDPEGNLRVPVLTHHLGPIHISDFWKRHHPQDGWVAGGWVLGFREIDRGVGLHDLLVSVRKPRWYKKMFDYRSYTFTHLF